jgi:uncharacterized protein (DUF1501 family)
MTNSRRDFLKKTGGCALGMVSLATQMHHLGTMSAMAQKVMDNEPEGGDAGYKALVLLYWAGGNDGNNMIIPTHTDAAVSSYTDYFNARNTQGLALTQTQLAATSINVPRMGNRTYALHPNFGALTQNGTTIVNTGIHSLWGLGKLAAVVNVGNLVRPLTKAQFQSSAFKKPYQLFSHSDQVNQSQTSNALTQAFTGWGGRVSDKLTVPGPLIPMITSIAGAQLFTAGQTTLPLAIADAGTSLANVLNPVGFTGAAGTARLNAFNAIRQDDLINATSDHVQAAAGVTEAAMDANAAFQQSDEVVTVFPNTSLGRQLKQVARIIKKRTGLAATRQIFYVQIGGFDTHSGQINGQGNQLTQVSQAMRAFWDEMGAQSTAEANMQEAVTLFTLSDFSRTLNPAGTGLGVVGSDHAWGNHMLVMGGAVAGGDFYGSKRPDGTGDYFPTMTMGGLDDTDSGAAPRGRWIPTTSVDQYAVRLARWFGLSPADEIDVFPNLPNFTSNEVNAQLNFLV